MEDDGESKTDYDGEEVRSAIKIQAFIRASLSRIKVSVVLSTLIEDMLEQQRQENTDDDISETGSGDSESFENISLASDDFLGAELKAYLELKFDKDDPYASDDDETKSIIRPSERRDTWITHTPTGGRKTGKWSAAAIEMSQARRGSVKERSRIFDSQKSLLVEDLDDDDDDGTGSLGDFGAAPSTPIFEKSAVRLGSSMNTFLSPSKFTSKSPRRATIAFSPGEKPAEAVVDKVSIFQKFANHSKVAKESMDVKPKPLRRKKKNQADDVDVTRTPTAGDLRKQPREYDIDTCRTPTAGDLRKNFESGKFFNAKHMPKLQLMESAESEGIKAKIAKLGMLDKAKKEKEQEVAPEEPKARERNNVNFATKQYIRHDAATKIQALARGFLFRQKDRNAFNKVVKWLQQHQEIQQVLTGDPSKVSAEERALAVQELTRTIHLLLPEEYMDDDYGSMSSDDSGSFGEDSFEEELLEEELLEEELLEEELLEEDLKEEKLRKSLDISGLMSAFATANGDSRSQLPVEGFKKPGGTLRLRQALIKASATKIQAVARGRRVRKSNCGAAVKALNWLKEYRLLGDLAAKNKKTFARDFDEDAFIEAIAAINELQQQLHRSATKIQSIGRGYTVRKFDMKTMMSVVGWIRKCQIELEEAEVPEQEQLEKTWIFLEKRWMREADLEKTEGSSLPETADAPSEQLDVDELVTTWEYLKQKESESKTGEKSGADETKPSVQELEKLSKWLVQNGHPYVPSIAMSGENKNDEILLSEPQKLNDVLQLWEFLQSNGVNVDVLRGDEMDNDNKKGGYSIEYIDEDFSSVYRDPKPEEMDNGNKKGGYSIEYIDEDFSSVYKDPKPSIEALINYWNFTRKHEIETILESRQTEDSAVEVSQNDIRDTSTEPVQTEDIDEGDAESISTDISEEKPKPVLAKKRRMGANIDNMMSSLKWLKKKGVNLNKVKSRTSIGTRVNEAQRNANNATDQPPSISDSDMKSTLERLKEKGISPPANIGDDMSSMLAWLNEKGFDPNSKNAQGSGENRMENALSWLEQKGFNVRKDAIEEQLAAPTPAEVAAMIVMLDKQKGLSQEGRPSSQEMQQALKWVSLQDQTEQKTKKKSKSKGAKQDKSKSRKKTRKSRGKTSTEVSRDNMQYALAFLQKAGKAEPDSSNLKGLEKTVDYMKQQVESQRVSSLRLKPEQKVEQAPEKKESMEIQDVTGYEQSALDWLTNQGDHFADAPYFKKLDKMLPGKDSQTNEQRAKEIAKAMKWMKKQGRLSTKEEIPPEAPPEDDFPGPPLAPPVAVREKIKEKAAKGKTSPIPTVKDMTKKKKKEKSKDGQSSTKSPRNPATPTVKAMLSPKKSKKKTIKGSKKSKMGEDNSPEKDFELAVEWLNTKDENMEAANYFKKLDAMVPNNPEHTTEERARELVKALKLVRRTSEKKMQEDDAKIAARKAATPTLKAMLSPKKSKKKSIKGSKKSKMGEENSPEKDLELAVEWLNSKDEKMEAANYFKKLDGMVPKNPDHTTEERARELVKALNWVRRTSEKKKMQEDAAKIAASPRKSKMKSVRSPKTMKSPTKESSKKKIKLKRADNEKTTKTVIGLKDLAKVQKTKDASSSKKKDKQKTGDTESNNDSKPESTPERDYENALSFIRIKEEGGNVMDVEDANYFKKLDNMLPKKDGQGDRAKEMVKMLGWMRKKGIG